MRHNATLTFLLFCWLVFSFAVSGKAQLCSGSLGDPVVNITFGSGPNPGPALSAATTNYQYVTNACPVNGFYTVLSSGIECNYAWHVLPHDHTGNANGYFMLIDASFNTSDFYLDTVRSLCANTTYEFAAWILNMKNIQQGIKPDITFSIETPGGQVLQSYTTGDVPAETVAQWRQYGFYFKTPANVPDIVLRMTNKAPGGDGNDLALDDITFRPCGPLVSAVINSNNSTDTISNCEGDTTAITFKATVSAGYNAPEYQWQISTDKGLTWSDIPGANTGTYKRPATGAGTYLYRLTVSEAGNIGLITCRVASNPLTVTTNTKPVTNATNDGPKCAKSTFTLTAGGGATYKWSGPGNYTATGATVTVNSATDGLKYYVTVTSSFGCAKKDSTVVTVYANPAAKFAGSTPACENGQVSFTDQSTAAAGQNIAKRSWNFGNNNISADTNPVHIFAPANTYPVSLAVTDSRGCKDTLVQPLTVHYLPQPDFGLPKVCLTDPFAAFTDASLIQDNSEAGFTYAWNFGDAGSNTNTSTQKNPQHTYTSTGVYNVKLMVTSKDGCIQDTLKAFTVNGALPKASFTIDNGVSICSNSDVTITDNSSVNFGSIARIEVYWDYNNNPSAKLTDDTVQQHEKYSTAYTVFDAPATKDYRVKYVAYSGISCVNELDTIITIKASPLLSFSTLTPVCAGIDAFTFTQGKEINGMSGTGTYSGDGTNTTGLFNPGTAGAGLHTIRYTFTADNTCSAFIEQPIKVFAQPTADAGPDRTLLQGGSLTIAATASGNGLTYLWTPGIAIDDSKTLMPKVSPSNDITYTLTVTSADGCVSIDDMNIKILLTPLIPNAFSPNGDGINDRWQINYLDTYQGATVQVYNRYGQLVFSSVGYSIAWDGTFKGKPLPVGTYYYIIDRKIATTKLAGWVAIVR